MLISTFCQLRRVVLENILNVFFSNQYVNKVKIFAETLVSSQYDPFECCGINFSKDGMLTHVVLRLSSELFFKYIFLARLARN